MAFVPRVVEAMSVHKVVEGLVQNGLWILAHLAEAAENKVSGSCAVQGRFRSGSMRHMLASGKQWRLRITLLLLSYVCALGHLLGVLCT